MPLSAGIVDPVLVAALVSPSLEVISPTRYRCVVFGNEV